MISNPPGFYPKLRMTETSLKNAMQPMLDDG